MTPIQQILLANRLVDGGFNPHEKRNHPKGMKELIPPKKFCWYHPKEDILRRVWTWLNCDRWNMLNPRSLYRLNCHWDTQGAFWKRNFAWGIACTKQLAWATRLKFNLVGCSIHLLSPQHPRLLSKGLQLFHGGVCCCHGSHEQKKQDEGGHSTWRLWSKCCHVALGIELWTTARWASWDK